MLYLKDELITYMLTVRFFRCSTVQYTVLHLNDELITYMLSVQLSRRSRDQYSTVLYLEDELITCMLSVQFSRCVICPGRESAARLEKSSEALTCVAPE